MSTMLTRPFVPRESHSVDFSSEDLDRMQRVLNGGGQLQSLTAEFGLSNDLQTLQAIGFAL